MKQRYQIDYIEFPSTNLPASKRSGLVEAQRALVDIEGIALIQFGKRDVVRHPLVQRIVGAYERHRGTQQPT